MYLLYKNSKQNKEYIKAALSPMVYFRNSIFLTFKLRLQLLKDFKNIPLFNVCECLPSCMWLHAMPVRVTRGHWILVALEL